MTRDVMEPPTATPHHSPAPEFTDEDTIDLGALLQTLRASRRTVFGITAICTVIALVIALVLPTVYTSTTSFIPPSLGTGSAMATALAGQLSALGGGTELLGGGKTPGELYSGVLRSRSVAEELVKRFDLIHLFKVKKESQAEKVLASDTVIGVDAKSTIVTVSVTEKSPQLAHDIASAYMDSLRATEGRLALGQSSQRRLFFGRQLAKEKDDLEEAEVELKKTEEQTGLIAPLGQTEAQIRTISETQAQVAFRETQLAALRQSSTEENPNVIRLRSEIQDLQNQLARLSSGSGKGTSSIPTSRVPQVQLDYVRRMREVKYHETLYEMLSKQYEAARLDEAHDAPVIQVLDLASYPDSKSGPKRTFIVAGGLFLGLLGGSGYVLLRARKYSPPATVSTETRA